MSFKREKRYLVLKVKDLATALNELPSEDQTVFWRVVRGVGKAQDERGKARAACVVVESDWSIFNAVWKLVEVEDRHRRALARLKQEASDA